MRRIYVRKIKRETEGDVLVKHVFIINPNAGKRDQTARIYHMADRLRD